MPIITEQELIDAAADAQTLEDVVNGAANFGGDGLVHPRAGGNLKTLAKIEDEINTTGTGWLATAQEWATKTSGQVAATDYSAKAYAIGGTGVDNTIGSAKDWAIKTGGDVISGQKSAKQHALDAAATLASVTAIADSMVFRDVIFLSFADSPYTFDADDTGVLFSIDTSGGNFVGNLPAIAGLTLPYVIAFKKSTGDTNTVTLNRASTDTINDGVSTSKVISSIGGSTFYPDTDTSPDRWTTSDFGTSAGEEKRQVFAAGTDFTAGSTTTLTVTTTPIPATSTGLDIVFDGVTQISEEWTYNPSTGVITFDEAIPVGVTRVEARWRTSLPIGTTGDGTVSWAKLASGIIASAANMWAGAADYILSAANFSTFLAAGVPIQTLKNTSTAAASTTTVIPADNTIPQNTEGTEVTALNTTITPKRASSLLEIEVHVPAIDMSTNNVWVGALFKDSDANALTVGVHTPYATNYASHYILKYIVAAGSTTARTYKFRYGPGAASTAYFNRGAGSATLFGNVQQAYMKVTEIAQ